ncbi:hypothetical protein Q8A73_022240 [Channa argus]|nr:hypothetical protein Q8A73_022240 [Channa argus]
MVALRLLVPSPAPLPSTALPRRLPAAGSRSLLPPSERSRFLPREHFIAQRSLAGPASVQTAKDDTQGGEVGTGLCTSDIYTQRVVQPGSRYSTASVGAVPPTCSAEVVRTKLAAHEVENVAFGNEQAAPTQRFLSVTDGLLDWSTQHVVAGKD